MQTPDEVLREAVALHKTHMQNVSSHPRFSRGDEVRVGRGVTVYEIEAAYEDGTVLLVEADNPRRRKLTIDTAKRELVDVELTEQTQQKREAADRERRVQGATDWLVGYIETMRSDAAKQQQRFDEYAAKGFAGMSEYVLGYLGHALALRDVLRELDRKLKMPDFAERPLYDAVVPIAASQLRYHGGWSSEPYHNLHGKQVQAIWQKLLTTALATQAHANNDPARDIL